MIDQHFTPKWVSDSMAAIIPTAANYTIVDPAAGEGSLLRAAQSKSDDILAIAIDADPKVTTKLRQEHPDWLISTADALEKRSRNSSLAWRSIQHSGADWVLLNPPFSYRGGPSRLVSIGDFLGKVSPSAEFIAMALTQIRPNSGIIAILPDGVLNGEKYEPFWGAVSNSHSLQITERLSNSTFPAVRASCSVVVLTPLSASAGTQPPSVTPAKEPNAHECMCVEVMRGRIPRHTQASFAETGQDVRYLHTTDISNGLVRDGSATAPKALSTAGPTVIIPRVGVPRGKVAVSNLKKAVLSDCLFALRPVSQSHVLLAQIINENLSELEEMYVGTGAPYTTLKRINSYLTQLGWVPRHSAASASPGECQCLLTPKTNSDHCI